MSISAASFFPPGTKLAAVPSWDAPRLVSTGATMRDRWNNSALYPGYKLRGRLYRIAMRAASASGLGSRTPDVLDSGQSFSDFLEKRLPNTSVASVLVGTAGPAQKTTVELKFGDGRLAGYAKYGEKPSAKIRVRSEFDVLSALPDTVGPRVLGFGAWRDGFVLITSPIEGRRVGTSLPPDAAIVSYLRKLETGPEVALFEHPFVSDLLDQRPDAEQYLGPLSTRRWAVTIQHGDFAPWNARRADAAIHAFDWEYGRIDGFPGLDMAFYWLQTLALIRRSSPQEAFRTAVAGLSDYFDGLDRSALESIVRLAVVDAYLKAEADGHPESYPIQAWRRELMPGIS